MGTTAELTPLLMPQDTDEVRKVRNVTALCLSGGGYRAMLFHVGSIWRLNEVGLLHQIKRFSSVSGGSLTAGRLAMVWNKLNWVNGVALDFYDQVVQPIRNLAYRTLDKKAVLIGGALPLVDSSDLIVNAYEDHLFGKTTLQDLPPWASGPEFIFCATSVQSGVLVRFSRPSIWDYRVGKFPNPTLPLSHAIAASSAFPPVLSPFRLDLKTFGLAVQPGTGKDLERPPYSEVFFLTDGGVYDNLGIEGAWKNCKTVFVSDAEKGFVPEDDPHEDYLRHMIRIGSIASNQSVALRKRFLIAAYSSPRRERLGCYWCNRGDIANYMPSPAPAYPFAVPVNADQTRDLANYPTRLAAVETDIQERLMNWAYLITDLSLRKHFDATLPLPTQLPFPGRPI